MKLEQWVLFIDMLGYGALNSKINTDEEALDLISFMKENVEIFKNQENPGTLRKYNEESFILEDYYDIEILFISDSLVINYKPKELVNNIDSFLSISHSANAMIMIIFRLQSFLWNCISKKGIFVRGGISNKYCKVDGNFAVGSGLIEAYKMESKFAIYPRICFAKSVTDNKSLMMMFRWLFQRMYYLDVVDVDESVNGKIYSINYIKFQLGILKKWGMMRLKILRSNEARKLLQKIAPEEFKTLTEENRLLSNKEIDNLEYLITRQINVFFKFVKAHKLEIERNLALFVNEPISHDVKSKYLWIKQMHNDSIDYFVSTNYKLFQEEIKETCFNELLIKHKIS